MPLPTEAAFEDMRCTEGLPIERNLAEIRLLDIISLFMVRWVTKRY